MDRIHRTGTSRAEHRKEAGAQEAMAGGLHGRGLVPQPGHSSRNPSTPPNFNGVSRGYQEPSGARHKNRNRTHSNKTIYRTRQTGQDNPQEQEALLGRARKLRSLQGMTWSQGPSPGCLRNRFHFNDRRGRWLGMACAAMTRGAACLRRVSTDKTRSNHIERAIIFWPTPVARLF